MPSVKAANLVPIGTYAKVLLENQVEPTLMDMALIKNNVDFKDKIIVYNCNEELVQKDNTKVPTWHENVDQSGLTFQHLSKDG